MNWFGICSSGTPAAKRYQRRLMTVMAVYVALVFGCTYLSRYVPARSAWLYVVAVLPAIPIMLTMLVMGRYLQEEQDEFIRMQVVQGILVGAAVLLSTMVVNDFLRTIAHTSPLPPFVGYVLFFAGMGVTQAVLSLRNRAPKEE